MDFALSDEQKLLIGTARRFVASELIPLEQEVEEKRALDPAKARDLANEVDKLIWAEGFSLPLTQSPGNIAVRSTLANFGAFGLADADYTKIGFMKP